MLCKILLHSYLTHFINKCCGFKVIQQVLLMIQLLLVVAQQHVKQISLKVQIQQTL